MYSTNIDQDPNYNELSDGRHKHHDEYTDKNYMEMPYHMYGMHMCPWMHSCPKKDSCPMMLEYKKMYGTSEEGYMSQGYRQDPSPFFNPFFQGFQDFHGFHHFHHHFHHHFFHNRFPHMHHHGY